MLAEPPELDEMVAVLREIVTSGEAYTAANPDEAQGKGPEWERWQAAFARAQTLVLEIDQALEATYAR